jgi:hypothetical protein
MAPIELTRGHRSWPGSSNARERFRSAAGAKPPQPLTGPLRYEAPRAPRPQWVGTGRTAKLCLPIPPVVTVRATFTAHGGRLSGYLP